MKDIHVSKETLRKCVDEMFKPNKEFYKWWRKEKERGKDDNNKKNATKI